jgi:L-lactate dehydrogenase complex protein LldG
VCKNRSLDLVAQFTQAAKAVAATVESVPADAQTIADAVSRAAPKAARIAVAEPRDLDPALFAACRRLPGIFSERTRESLAIADVGVTEAFACVATTGSVCVASDGDTSYVSLLPRMHIAIARKSDIVARPGDLLLPEHLDGKGLTRNFVYVTGPSATADMGPLVRGVHGPHYLHVILLD